MQRLNRNCLECSRQARWGEKGGIPVWCKWHKKPSNKKLTALNCSICNNSTGRYVQFWGGFSGPQDIARSSEWSKDKIWLLPRFCESHRPMGAFSLQALNRWKLKQSRLRKVAQARRSSGPLVMLAIQDEEPGSAGTEATGGLQHHKRCRHPDGCMRQPSFGEPPPAAKVAEYCKEHKREGQIDVRNPPCGVSGCSTRPSYGERNGIPLFCAKHRRPGHVDLKNKAQCRGQGCQKRARYGFRNGSCDGVNNGTSVDSEQSRSSIGVKMKRDLQLPANKSLFCSQHRPPGTVRLS
mmetsp:Transcript_345/g.623  ORF Transcript_345/g.623 Transcript_345/m.623 type:complete len:294 (+) Transcript_345:319-1200(+)